MINLRYHIISITAVFLALGIGLAFGAAFIDRATVDALERNLTRIEQQNAELEEVNDELARELVEAAEVDAGLRTEGLPQLVEGRLDEVPVLVLAASGTGDDVLAATETALVDAGAAVPGVLSVTERFSLDDDDEVEDLQTVLGLPGAGADQLRTAVIRRLRTILTTAAQPTDGESGDPVPVPPLLQALIDEGFLELDGADVPPESFALVPEGGLHLVVVSGPEADVADEDLLLPLIDLLVTPSPSDPSAPAPPLLAAQPPLAPPDPDTEDEPLPFVEVLRADEAVRDRLSTVDELGPFHGLLAMVLALEHVPSGQLGHYGTSDSAQLLLPPAAVESGDDGDDGEG